MLEGTGKKTEQYSKGKSDTNKNIHKPVSVWYKINPKVHHDFQINQSESGLIPLVPIDQIKCFICKLKKGKLPN